MKPSRYEEAGVSIDAQDQAIEQIRGHVGATNTPRVLSDLGSFGGLFDIRFPEMDQPVMVASADGVGTKLKIAFDAEVHDTVGQCLVNHCIDDILVQGARPLFFMDYVATGKLKPHVVADVVKGMSIACKASDCAILGGEMAEMPGFYKAGEYDVAGFIVGVVDRKKLLGEDRVRAGQKLIGLAATGLHTNGYSLARKIIFEEQGLKLADELPGTGRSVQDNLLAIHRSYYKPLADLLDKDHIQAMAHITGGGFLDNVPRILPKDLSAHIAVDSYSVPPLFQYLVDKGGVDRDEAYRVFNMGIGMILVVEAERAASVTEHCAAQNLDPVALGEIKAGDGTVVLT
ncbi:phosphoribosylformylglycinamidine cyclo-ligase [Acanthopleuribacter pedis]|uniref:Phosphoribosylformylglycinamidine cyclo-ligase n=1 Tax=Acanthopleuribacter pedis TaxID=442870 RepID=A0A8J7U7P0_9BACT|nr:phosphoribosylformylglycinamidine cyclo-ligase [Acanthopleuribacter pedis]MBO1323204.1 phosphoribosylformylglycinamidine cyclo-ligase [Acanthopleuribacter pedis]